MKQIDEKVTKKINDMASKFESADPYRFNLGYSKCISDIIEKMWRKEMEGFVLDKTIVVEICRELLDQAAEKVKKYENK